MNYLIATAIGLVAGLLVPRIFTALEMKSWVAALIGAGSALGAFYVINFTGIYPSGFVGLLLASLTGVVLAFVNLKQYYRPSFPWLTVVVRVFLGLFMLSTAIMMWKVNPAPGESLPGMQSGPVWSWLQAVIDSGFLWQWIFVFKAAFGILVLIPRTVTIGLLGALPYYINITIYTIFLAHLWLHLSIAALVATVYLLYAYRAQYRGIVAVSEQA